MEILLPVLLSSPLGVGGSGGIRAAAGHYRTSRDAWPCVPLLWATGAGSQPGCGRALCPQGGGPVLFCSLGPGLAVRESREVWVVAQWVCNIMGRQSCSDSVATWAGITVCGFGIQGFPLIYSVFLMVIVTCYHTPSISALGPPFMIFCSPTLPSFRIPMLLTYKAPSLP